MSRTDSIIDRRAWNFQDLTGRQFGRLTVLGLAGRGGPRGKSLFWLCRCECGNQKEVLGENLKSGNSQSCGCLRSELMRSRDRPNSRKHNFVGRTFGRLLVVALSDRVCPSSRYWVCKCECGKLHEVSGTNLIKGHVRSCGCFANEDRSRRATVHGHHKGKPSGELNSYYSARNRCHNRRNISYPSYGGRGIEFRFASFQHFLETVGPRPTPRHTLDRYPDTNGHYEPGNVRWATAKEQGRNKRNTRMITVDGQSQPLNDVCDRYDIKPFAVLGRLALGWCEQCSATIPTNKKRCRKKDVSVCPHRSATSSPRATRRSHQSSA